jgi:alkylation response protein AidB-like acyl-CoA dehydrogenase
VDVRLSAEQVALRDSVAQVMHRLGPSTVAALDDSERTAKLDATVASAGWRELRTSAEDGGPWASGAEVALVAEELGRGLADIAFAGPTLAAELRRLAGAPALAADGGSGETVVLAADLATPGIADDGALPTGSVAIDCRGAVAALVLVPSANGMALAQVALDRGDADDAGAGGGVDLTRTMASVDSCGAPVPLHGPSTTVSPEDLTRWHALGLALASADLVGTMRGAIDLSTDYARTRVQYGAPIGSFQAVQHLLADAFVLMEGSRSAALHAAWAADALPADEAYAAACVAKAYCGRAARSVCETAIQVHGGIGNTWECLAHVYLRRALFSTELLGGVGESVARVMAAHGIGDDDGLR